MEESGSVSVSNTADEAKMERIKQYTKPGISKPLIQELKKRLKALIRKERVCVLLFKEYTLIPNEEDEDKSTFVTIFMIRSIFGKWKQPVAYFFTESSPTPEMITSYFKQVVKTVVTTRIEIIASVCNEAKNNIKAIDILIEETKRDASSAVKDDIIVIGKQTIVPLFDPPSLLINIRDNMLLKELRFKEDEVTRVGKWWHIQDNYEISKLSGINFWYKFDETYLDPDKMDRKKVSVCTKVFSRVVASYTYNVATTEFKNCRLKVLPPDAEDTGRLVHFLDNIFDSVNGGFEKPQHWNSLRHLVGGKSRHRRMWMKGIEMFSDMEFVGSDPADKPTVFHLWIRTLKGFLLIREKLYIRYRFFAARAFNLDPLQNFFDLLKRHAKTKANLTSEKFIEAYGKTMESREASSKHYFKTFNCERDRLVFLVTAMEDKFPPGTDLVLRLFVNMMERMPSR